jgi:crotonobetainyl-CoA:carnitine CoA-transferase CaiB-like acyl-CoA transferase
VRKDIDVSNDLHQLPLTGIRVLSFTHTIMGPAAGMILADLGAEVIHVEPPTGDPTRRLQGSGTGYFAYFNRNKKSLAVDLKVPEGREIIFKLIEKTDILIENFGPRTMHRLGYDYSDAAAINPKLIYCSLKGFLPGPYEYRTATDEVAQMMSGLAFMTGPPGQPLRAGTSIIDITGGMFGVIGVLTALYDREKTGAGGFVKSSLFETAAFTMGQHMASAELTEEPILPMPARVSPWSVYQRFETSDNDQVFIGLISEKHWERFCIAFDRKDLLTDERLKTNNQRVRERDWLHPELEKMIRQLTKARVMELCDKAGVCFAPIARPEDLFDDPHLTQGKFGLLETTLPTGKKAKLPRLPIQIGTCDFGISCDPPAKIGQDTRGLLLSLGYDKDVIDHLAKKGVIALGRR